MAKPKKAPSIEDLQKMKADITRQISEAKRKEEERIQAEMQDRIQRLAKAMIKGGVLKKTDAEILQMLGIEPSIAAKKSAAKKEKEKTAQANTQPAGGKDGK